MLLEKFENYIIENKLIDYDDNILVAVSGGKDSVTLLDLLSKVKKKYNLTIEVAHINHLVRGELAYRDEEFVRDLSIKYNYNYHIKRKSMEKYAKELKISDEEAGRKIRKEFLYSILENKTNKSVWKIATGHNRDDQAETVLMRILRGTGLDGLKGISVKSGMNIRPILAFSRKEIESYVKNEKLTYVEDHTNFENDYTRNKIRNQLIPFLEEEYNPNVKEALVRLSKIASSEKKLLDEYNKEKIKKIVVKESKDYIKIDREKFLDSSESFQVELLRWAIVELLGHNKGFTYIHYKELIDISKLSSGREKTINGIIFYVSFDFLIFRSKILENDLKEDIIVNGSGEYLINNYRIIIDIRKKTEEKIKIRKRQNGDKVIINKQSKKLKDFFIERKIDKYERDLYPIVSYGDQIISVGPFILLNNREEINIKVEEL